MAGEVRTRHGRNEDGWWWGVWQGRRLVGFGTNYPKHAQQRCLEHLENCKREAFIREMTTLKCFAAYVSLGEVE